MSKLKTDKELIQHKQQAFDTLDIYLTNLIQSKNSENKSKADKILYWIETYTTFIDYEKNFNPSTRCKYKRGQVIKADFGFRIGSEYGGLHYAIVMDNDNSIHSPVVTVIPLTSVKQNFTVDKLKKGQVYLGDEIYNKLNDKISLLNSKLIDPTDLSNLIDELILHTKNIDNTSYNKYSISKIVKDALNKISSRKQLINKINNEISRMKHGSIAIANQITTISKIRISDPKNSGGVLSNIRISNESLDLLDNEILKLYTHNKL